MLSSLAILTPDLNLVLPKYLYFVLSSERFVSEAIDRKTGVAIRRIVLKTLKAIPIPLPPLEVQKEIVAEIEGYQKIIDGARQVLENYQPHIPIHPDWPIVKIGDLCKPEYGFTASALDAGSHRFVRITDIGPDGHLKVDDAKFIDVTDESRRFILSQGDLLVARTGATYGKTMLFDQDVPAIFASYLIRLRFPADRLEPKYYWAFAQSEGYWTQAQSLVTGGGQPQFNGNALVDIKFPLPVIEIQRAIVMQIEEEQRLVNANKELIRRFEAKIKTTINRVWGESDAASSYRAEQPEEPVDQAGSPSTAPCAMSLAS